MVGFGLVFAAVSLLPLCTSFSPTTSLLPRSSTLPSASLPRTSSLTRLTPPLSSLRMGGANVPRVPYKAPGEQSYQFMDIWNRLYRERIMYIGQDLDDEFANQMVAVLLWLSQEDDTSDVQLYFNCPGGEVRAGLAVYDTMRSCNFGVQTLNLGIAAAISAFLCGAGDKGKRMALPNARFLLQTPKLEDMGLSQVLYGQASDVKIEAEEILRMREKVYKGYMDFTDKDYETIRKDLTRDLYLTSVEAVDYGLIDKMLLPLERTKEDYDKIAKAADPKNFGRI
uniref:ATP-dependent Clp protease proteolytic subunit n=2 Tax=Hemiselmis andersenii TaxID=464988 RepID=A0A6U4NKV9_HEMAN|eukprot:CAMPEP_0114127652 /NCGR_PEP_ID=MMETSP0043_2-20121206/10499_1 /TAXON_ID=464988 /ORGANISM="Hemiselmis andersenii, Strain CCMP644" /LENGTH=281 /DNA_ID=CAMNT_0001220761 /DNA_START=54 /DNA_END=899 /DNA_ORIENTATION=-